MIYSSYTKQVESHIDFLYSYGLDIRSLEFGKFIRCHAIGENGGRGKHAYICHANRMGNGSLIGLSTWCRGKSGEQGSFRTYGPPSSYNAIISPATTCSDDMMEKHKTAAGKAYGFWKNSSLSGQSDYLSGKCVGSYGIRFRSSEQYGNVAVVPMQDENGYLWSCQVLNPDGSKRMTSKARTKGLFHKLNVLTNGSPIGIAESYVTAATCFELSGIPAVCSFSADNIPSVALSIRKLYSESFIILFADNDRHLEATGKSNKGSSKALEALHLIPEHVCIVNPDFYDLEPSKEASDWNDLVRIKGGKFAKMLIQQKIALSNPTLKKVING